MAHRTRASSIHTPRSGSSSEGIADIQFLLIELEKSKPNTKIIRTLTAKYGIPYRKDVADQLDELLLFLDRVPIVFDQTPESEL